jgi:hypothetical protein
MVEVPESERAVGFNITARQSQLTKIDIRGRAAKLSRSAYLVHSALEKNKSGVIEIALTRRKTQSAREVCLGCACDCRRARDRSPLVIGVNDPLVLQFRALNTSDSRTPGC